MVAAAPAALSTFGMFLYELRDRQLRTLDTDRRMSLPSAPPLEFLALRGVSRSYGSGV
jgi:hypothetical protein